MFHVEHYFTVFFMIHAYDIVSVLIKSTAQNGFQPILRDELNALLQYFRIFT